MANRKREFDTKDWGKIKEECHKMRRANHSYMDISKAIQRRYGIERTPETVAYWVRDIAVQIHQQEGYGNLSIQTVRGMSELRQLEDAVDNLLAKKYVEYSLPPKAGGKIFYRELSQRAYIDLLKLKCNIIDKMNEVRGLKNAAVRLSEWQQNSFTSKAAFDDREIEEEICETTPELQARIEALFRR